MYQRAGSKGNSPLAFTLGTGLPLWVQSEKPVSNIKELVAATDTLRSSQRTSQVIYYKIEKLRPLTEYFGASAKPQSELYTHSI